MSREFFGGPGFRPPFRPFPHPFFPRRFLFPFFFFSPFFFPFFRDDGTQTDPYFAQHQAQAGDTLDKVAYMYNIPCPVLEEANPHITNPNELQAGTPVYIPRISHMYCQKTYVEREVDSPSSLYQGQTTRQPGAPYSMY